MDHIVKEPLAESLSSRYDEGQMVRAPSTVPDPPSAYEDPYLSMRDALWYHSGINDLVMVILEKMERMFAYNSVFFLKSVLDLQIYYLTVEPPPPPTVKLDLCNVQKIVEKLVGRLARKDKDNSSPSRELQLRALVSALSLLSQSTGWKMDHDSYASLLNRLSERDYRNFTKFVSGGLFLGSGNFEFLVRYACDLARCMPNDFVMNQFEGFGSQAVHFMLAAGFVNQVGGEPTLEQMEGIYARMTASPSEWHQDLSLLAETVSHTISLGYHYMTARLDVGSPMHCGPVPGNIPRIIIERIQKELGTYDQASYPLYREAQLFITALLDLLVQLVTTFPSSEEAIEHSEQLALSIIMTSHSEELRLKAFELIIASTTGCDEAEFFDAMRDLESYIVKVAGSGHGTNVEQLRREKRAAMARYEKKMILYRGAIESLHRKLQNSSRHGIFTDPSPAVSPSWDRSSQEQAMVSPEMNGIISSRGLTYSPIPQCSSGLSFPNTGFYDTARSSTFPITDLMDELNEHQGARAPYSLHSITPNVYERPNTTVSGYPQTDRLERPLSFQRDAAEILEVPLQIQNYQQNPALPQEELSPPVGAANEAKSDVDIYTRAVTTHGLEIQPEEEDPLAASILGGTVPDQDHENMPPFTTVGTRNDKGWGQAEDSHMLNPQQNTGMYSTVSDIDAHTTDKVTGLYTKAGSRNTFGLSEEETRKQPYLESLKEIPMNATAEQDLTWMNVIQNDDLFTPGNRNTQASFELPIQGINDEEYCLPKPQTESIDRRQSHLSPIPVASELEDLSIAGEDIRYPAAHDESGTPEVVEVIPMQVSSYAPIKKVHFVPKKKLSRAYRLLASLPGSSGKSNRLSRLGSLRSSSSQSGTLSENIPMNDQSFDMSSPSHPLSPRESQTSPDVVDERLAIQRRHAHITYKSAPGAGDYSPNFSAEPSTNPPLEQDFLGSSNKLDYEFIVTEQVYKLIPKENSFPFLALDCRHVIYMCRDSFQVFSVPTPQDPGPVKARFSYRLGEAEGLKRGKVPWQYRAGAASRRHIATISKQRVQIHDLQQNCNPIYTKKTQDHEYHSITIAADKMAVGMAPITGGVGEGAINIFKMRSATNQKWEEWKLIRLTVPHVGGGDNFGVPYLLSLTRDGRGLTACTRSGHFFAWDITSQPDPILINRGRILTETDTMMGAEVLTGCFLFPNMEHILCSTMSMSDNCPGWVGCFTEPTRSNAQIPPHYPIRQVGLRTHHSAVSPNGRASAFLSFTGRISVVPMLHVDGDPNATSSAAICAEQKLQSSLAPESAGRIMFTPEGDMLIGVDKKGKVIVLHFTP